MLQKFNTIKEIDSLNRKVLELSENIAKEESRVTKIESRITQSDTQKDELLSEIKTTSAELTKAENELESFGEKLQKKESQKASLFTDEQIKAIEREVEAYKLKIEELENITFELMEKKEQLETTLSDTNSFLSGAANSLIEIRDEVKEESNKFNLEIDKLKPRIMSLTDSLPADFKYKLEITLKKDLRATIVSTITQGACNYCRASLSSNEVSEVEDKHLIKTCKACSRILIPSSCAY